MTTLLEPFAGEKPKEPARTKKRRTKIWVWSIVGALVLILGTVITLQLLYPKEQALPFAEINGESVGWQSYSEITQRTQQAADSATISIEAPMGKSTSDSLENFGATVDPDATFKTLSDYPQEQRFIPFSILFQRPQVTALTATFDTARLTERTAAAAKELSVTPTDAKLTVTGTDVTVSAEKSGQKVDASALAQQLEDTPIAFGGTTAVDANATEEQPQITAQALSQVQQEAAAIVKRPTVIEGAQEPIKVEPKQVADWISVDTGGDKPALTANQDAIRAYVDGLNKELSSEGKADVVTVVDGEETKREKGEPAAILATDQLVQAISDNVLKDAPKLTIGAQLTVTELPAIYNETFTHSEKGLQAYVDTLGRDMNVTVSLQQLEGEKWSASTRGSESRVSASDYKLFVALYLFDQINKGKMSWGDQVPGQGTDVAGCFDRMTVDSTNPCAEEWLREFGRDNVNKFIWDKGFSRATKFSTDGSATVTSANDLTKFMVGMYNDTLVSGANKDRLITNLGRHPFRYGIPTGSSGAVYDKVGFLWDYVNDSGIVVHPGGDYVITVMTKGQSYAKIAEITRTVEDIMYGG
ncbi:serine hydrolase [Haematomicrobium sanguinis]|uniref:serine hydrolase n=1 Tax=Haematomicrobium sanguinis TaxID=479106 RepID=UPI00047A6361|nr:serine hydrolase [Haematomicrobium sanguinis]